MYELKATAGFDAALTEENTAPGIVTLKLTAKSETAKKLEIRVKWYTEDIGVNAVWSPLSYRNKTVRPDWGRILRLERDAFLPGLLERRVRRHEPHDHRLLRREEQREDTLRRRRGEREARERGRDQCRLRDLRLHG